MARAVVTIVGLALIALIYWFFLMKREKVVEGSKGLEVKVEGGYSPETIALKKGSAATLTFVRTDPSSCLEEVVFPDFHIRKQLPLNKRVAIELQPKVVGEFPFACGMGMYHGKVIVSE